MNINLELQNQCNRFCEETAAIKSQVEFIEESLIMTAVKEKGSELTRPLIPNFKSIEEVHSQLNQIVQKLSINVEKLNESLLDNNYENIPEKFLGIDYRSDEGELIQYIIDIIENGETNPLKIAEKVGAELEALCIIEGENVGSEIYLELYDNNDRLIEYIDLCLKINHNNEIENIENSINLLNHHIKLLSLVDIKNSTNIYRQAFIQLIAIFDNIVFECFRIKFNLNFFEWLKYFKDGTIKYSEIANFKNFEIFQQEVIEEKLRNCYLKDLLKTANDQNKVIFTMDGDNIYPNFREIINRRNCLIHNNGIVDNAYIWTGTSHKENFNIYDLKIGEYLWIDKTYFSNSITMCSNFFSNFLENN